MSNLNDKIYSFLTTSPLEHITAFSVVFQAMEDNPWIEKEVLRYIVDTAVYFATDFLRGDLPAQNKIRLISEQVS
jgi:hypothetical protein